MIDMVNSSASYLKNVLNVLSSTISLIFLHMPCRMRTHGFFNGKSFIDSQHKIVLNFCFSASIHFHHLITKSHESFRMNRVWLVIAVLPGLLAAENDAPTDFTRKSAEDFVMLLESNDYWYRSYPDSTEQLIRPTLHELTARNAHYLPVIRYSKINMDYRYPVPDEEPFHDFTILELSFDNPEFIHEYESSRVFQLFPHCAGTYNIAESDMVSIFPLWDYEELIPDLVKWNTGSISTGTRSATNGKCL